MDAGHKRPWLTIYMPGSATEKTHKRRIQINNALLKINLNSRAAESWGLIYKMLHRNHPKFDLTIISKICVRASLSDVKSMKSQMILNLRAIEWFQLSAL